MAAHKSFAKSIVVSLVLPGVKTAFLEDALRKAIPALQLHLTSEFMFQVSDPIIKLWSQPITEGQHVFHGKEVFEIDFIFSKHPKITILGNPLHRALDTYRNILKSKEHPLHEELIKTGMDVSAFFASPLSLLARNRQCRKLVFFEDSAYVNSKKLFLLGKERLLNYAWVGLEGVTNGKQPALARVLRNAAFECSIPVFHQPKRKTPKINRETYNAIAKANSADFALWRFMYKRHLLKKFCLPC